MYFYSLKKYNMMRTITCIVFCLLASCASRKSVLVFQNKEQIIGAVQPAAVSIQVNDILSIQVSTLQPELAVPYNLIPANANQGAIQVETLKLQGYLVNQSGQINFPVLGTIQVAGKTVQELEQLLVKLLVEGNHLLAPTVNIRLLNGKVTILGQVARPGTYSFTEQNLTVLQALGLAGDLTIEGVRKEVLLIREQNGQRTYVTLDLTQTNWFSSDYYYIKQNDVLVVNPTGPKIKTAGYIGNAGTLLSAASVILSMIILLTR